jgi:hypothetical protein
MVSITAKRKPKRHLLETPQQIVVSLLVALFTVYGVASMALSRDKSIDNSSSVTLLKMALSRDKSIDNSSSVTLLKTKTTFLSSPKAAYSTWRKLAVNLAGLSAEKALVEMKKDPFSVRKFEKQLLERESNQGRVLEWNEVRELFPCPNDRLTLPDQRDQTKGRTFRDGVNGTFLYYQHLRKAGGTHFCSLASANLPKSAVHKYYCMPDKSWPEKRCAGCLHQFTNEMIAQRMMEDGYRVAANEWDNFDRLHHFDLPAVFATQFRRPLDRALSQFRFECVEDRGCRETKNVTEWWWRRKDLNNVYLRTFADPNEKARTLREIYTGQSPKDAQRRRELMGDAIDTVAQFHVVTILEWLAYAGKAIQRELGFQDTSGLTKRVRPHISQFKRNDGQETNKLGAAGVAKASWTPEDYLDAETYRIMSQDLALDEILTDVARRMFLERLVCQE